MLQVTGATGRVGPKAGVGRNPASSSASGPLAGRWRCCPRHPSLLSPALARSAAPATLSADHDADPDADANANATDPDDPNPADPADPDPADPDPADADADPDDADTRPRMQRRQIVRTAGMIMRVTRA